MSTAPQSFPYTGRAWQIQITPQGGGTQYTLSSAGATPTLRVTFDISLAMLVVAWQARVTIYNMNAKGPNNSSNVNNITAGSLQTLAHPSGLIPTADELSFGQAVQSNMGDIISISAGYYEFNSGTAFDPAQNLIFKGDLLQGFGTRENVVDNKIILRCVYNLALHSFGYLNFPRAKWQTDLDVLNTALSKIKQTALIIDQYSQQQLQNSKYSRGQAIYQRPMPFFQDLANQNGLYPWFDFDGLHVQSFITAPPAPKIIYAPPSLAKLPTGTSTTTVKPTIIGTPQQTQNGVLFKVLMDTQVKIGDLIQLAITTATPINAFEFPYMTLPPLPNTDGLYFVAGLRYVGDTRGRGDDWFTEITGLTPRFFLTRQQTEGVTH